MLIPVGSEFLLAVGSFTPYRISALGTSLNQLTLKLVAVTGLRSFSTVSIYKYSFKVPPEVLWPKLALSLRLIAWYEFLTSAHPESSCLSHKFLCKSNLALLAGGFGFRTVRNLMLSLF